MQIEVILPLFCLALIIVIVWALFSLVGEMARDRGHNPWPWWLLSIAWSPIASIIVLWLFFSVEDSR